MIILCLLLATSNNRIEKLQNTITKKVVIEIGVEDQRFFKIWRSLERYRWEQERLHWIILDSLSQSSDPKRIFHLIGRMRKIDSVYTRKIFELQDSLVGYIDRKKADRFIILRKRIGNRIKTIIKEIKSGED